MGFAGVSPTYIASYSREPAAPTGNIPVFLLRFVYIGLLHCCAIQLRHEEAIYVEPFGNTLSYHPAQLSLCFITMAIS